MDPINRVFGAAIIGLTTGSILALLDPKWEKVVILVRIEIVWISLGIIAMIYGMLDTTVNYPAFGWVHVLVLAFLLVLFGVGYYKEVYQK